MIDSKNSLKDKLIKTLEKKKIVLNKNLKKANEDYLSEKTSILTKIEVIDLQLQGLRKNK